MRRKHKVPEILWRLFRDRARPMAETIVSLLPPSPKQCKCKGKQCLGCSVDPLSFLLRPDDPSDYRKLLIRCFVVVSDNAPALRVFFPHCHWSQYETVRRTIELMLCEKGSLAARSNVLCSDFNKRNCSSPTVELLSCSSWDLLQSRVGDDMMVYILRNTSIFLPVPRRKHHQVAGPPVSGLCFKMSNCLSNLDSRHSSLPQGGNQKKRERTGDTDSTVGKRRCNTSIIFNGPACSASGLDFTGLKSSMPLTRHDGSEHHQTSSANVSKSSTGKCAGKHIAESEGEKSSEYPTARIRKRSRPFSWQRRQKRRQKLCSAETSTTTDCLHGSFHCSETSLSHHEKMPWECSCCLILQSVPAFPKRTEINRQSIFYNSASSPSVLPKKHIFNSVRSNLAGSKYIVEDIFGISEANVNADLKPCLHNSGSCLIGSECLYHSLVKLFKRVIRRTQCCQYKKLLDKHCAVPPWNQDPIGRSNSPHEGNVSEIGVQKKMHGFDSKHSVDTLEAIDSQHEAVKSYCSKSQVVSYIWAVSRSVLPPELLGNASQRRIMRRNIFKFICLRRFEKSHLKLCMQGLKTSIFPFLTTKYFSNSQDAQILKCAEGHNRGLDKEFRNWNHAVHVIKRKLLERWIFWYFSCLVVPLVQANFYVTESQHGKQDIYYYRKSVWEKLTNSTIACLEDGRYSYQNRKDGRYSHLDDVAVRNILMGRPFGFSKLRIRPKENGVRMVANLNSSSRLPSYMSSRNVQSSKMWRKANHLKSKFDHYQSVNFVLHDAHIILKDIQFKEPEKLGSSVFDYNDVGQFLIGLKEGSKSKPNFYIVISDVLKAFDSVDQDKLLDVMNEVLPKREYLLKQHDQVVCTKKSLWVRKHLSVRGENMCPGSEGFTSSASSRFLGTIFVNQERVKHVDNKVLFSHLKQHVKRNVLQLDGKFYLQGVGIPQGGVLSTLLCSLYYGHLERQVIFPFLERTIESDGCKKNHASNMSNNGEVSSEHHILMRFIDDILFISTSKKQAASFFSRLQRGFRAYNCYMNEKKFGVNFDVGQGSPSRKVKVGEDGPSFLCWSGLLINCCTLEIQADYTRYLNGHLRSTLTVSWQGKPGLRLKKKLRGFLRPKCHPIFFDSNINSAAVVRLNIYQSFLLCAMKFHCYICQLSFIFKLGTKSCLNSVKSSLSYMYELIKRKMHSIRSRCDFRPVLKLEKGEVEWLGLHAYVQVLKRKQSRHKDLLAILSSRLHSHRISSGVSPELMHAVDPSNSSILWNIKY